MTRYTDTLTVPWGRLAFTFSAAGLEQLQLLVRVPEVTAGAGRAPGGNVYRGALEAYFNGDLAALAGLPVNPAGTPFQRQVWQALRRIPPGRTISYAELARRIGRPRATRAVGNANGRNPIPLVIPCHRVIAADGSLGGFSGGLDIKRWLLRHEAALPTG